MEFLSDLKKYFVSTQFKTVTKEKEKSSEVNLRKVIEKIS